MPLRIAATFVAPATALGLDAETGSGFRVAADSAASDPRIGPSPREMVLVGLAGCTGMDVVSILGKKRQPPDAYEVTVEAQDDPDPPGIFTRVVVEHHVTGQVTVEAVRRAVELSATRYCPVSAMLSRAVPIEHRYRVSAPGQADQSGLVVTTSPNDPRR